MWPLQKLDGSPLTKAPEEAVKLLLWLEENGVQCAAVSGECITDQELPPRAAELRQQHNDVLCQLVQYCDLLREEE